MYDLSRISASEATTSHVTHDQDPSSLTHHRDLTYTLQYQYQVTLRVRILDGCLAARPRRQLADT